jgi:hypothetical protein
MTDVFMTLKFGHVHFSYSLYFILYLLIGWATIVLHARQNFDQPTYDLTQNEPTYIMVPRFFSSQHLYLRGFLIYLTGMTGIYLALSLAGPAIVLGIVAVFDKPEIKTTVAAIDENGMVPSQWPLVLALTIVGLAPNIAGLRTPEVVLRRFSHRVALIPAYAKYLAYQMQQSPFENAAGKFKYPAGIRHRPAAGSDLSVDKVSRRICIIFARIKELGDGVEIPESGRPLDDAEREPIQKEIQILDLKLRDVDAKLVAPSLDDEEQAAVESPVQRLLLRAYLVAACTIIAFRVKDIGSELKKMGFSQVGTATPTILPIFMVCFLLFLTLVLMNSTISTVWKGAASIVPPSFALNCISTSYTVLTYAVASFVAVVLFRKLDAGKSWQDGPTWTRRFMSFFLVALLAYIASWVALSILLFPIMAPQGIEKLGAFSTFRSIPPAVGAIFICAWLHRKEADWNHFANYLLITSVSIGAIAGFASLLLSGGVDDVGAVMTIGFDVVQGVVSGMALAFLSEFTRSYPGDSFFAAQAQPAPKAA